MITLAEIQQTDEWQELALPAKEHYRDDVPYHNWDGHVLSAVEDLVNMTNRCETHGIVLPVARLAVAMAWHDAGNFEDPKEHHMISEEAYAASLAEAFLIQKGQTEHYALAVGKAIMGTRHVLSHRNIEESVMHWADVANIGKLYEIFAGNSYRLLQEKRMKQPNLSFDQFVLDTRSFIGLLIAEAQKELPRLKEPMESRGSFPGQARENAKRLATETEGSLSKYGVAA